MVAGQSRTSSPGQAKSGCDSRDSAEISANPAPPHPLHSSPPALSCHLHFHSVSRSSVQSGILSFGTDRARLGPSCCCADNIQDDPCQDDEEHEDDDDGGREVTGVW